VASPIVCVDSLVVSALDGVDPGATTLVGGAGVSGALVPGAFDDGGC
jgi:hypothetical protein